MTMENKGNLSDEWQLYEGIHGQFEYDLMLRETGICIGNCYSTDDGESFVLLRSASDDTQVNKDMVYAIRFAKNRIVVMNNIFTKNELHDFSRNPQVRTEFTDVKSLHSVNKRIEKEKERLARTVHVRNQPKTGRNEVCRCGSGKKSKKCCKI